MGKQEYRIVVLGDAQTGKTTLITAMLTDTYQEQVAPTVPPVTIPLDIQDKGLAHIIDTSANPSKKKSTDEEIQKADCIVLVFDISQQSSFDRISSHWLIEIRKAVKSANAKKKIPPIILVGNKVDVLDGTSNLESLAAPLLGQHKEIEVCLECSVKTLYQVQDVFGYAQKAMLYPTRPIYNTIQMSLKEKAKLAFKRIFSLFDKDNDGILSLRELSDFQVKTFGTPLSEEELSGITDVIKQQYPGGVNEKGVLLSGFLELNHIFIMKGKIEINWQILRKHGYSDTLDLREDYLYPDIGIKEGELVELSAKGIEFFEQLFRRYDRDQDGALNDEELHNFFEITEVEALTSKYFDAVTVTNDQHNVTLQGFLSVWNMKTFQDYKETQYYLACYGYEDDMRTAFHVTKGKRHERSKMKISRNTFQCFVFGSTGAGKTAFLHGLIGKAFNPTYTPTEGSTVAVNTIPVEGKERSLILQEFTTDEIIRRENDVTMLTQCDMACLLYDTHDPLSFSYIAKLATQLQDKYSKVPLFIFESKCDLASVSQQSEISVQDFCSKRKIQTKQVSFKKGVDREVYADLVKQIYAHTTKSYNLGLIVFGGVLTIVVVGGAAAAGYIYYKKNMQK